MIYRKRATAWKRKPRGHIDRKRQRWRRELRAMIVAMEDKIDDPARAAEEE